MTGLSATSKEDLLRNNTFEAANTVKIKLERSNCIIKKGTSEKIEVQLEYSYPEEQYNPEYYIIGNTLVFSEEFIGKFEKDEYSECVKENHSRNYSKCPIYINGCTVIKGISGFGTWTITLPESTKIEGNTASGDFYINDLDSKIKLNTASGDIIIEDSSGQIVSNTASGDFLGKNITGDIFANTASGRIEVDSLKGGFAVNSASGDCILTNIDLNESSSFNSYSGDVSLKLAKSCNSDLSLKSYSGDIELNYNDNPPKGNFYMTSQSNYISLDIPPESETSYTRKGATIFIDGAGSPIIELSSYSGRAVLK